MDATPGAADAGAPLAGRYEVGPLVGLGGTAHVYRAWDRTRARVVAVKVFLPGSEYDPDRGGAWEMTVLDGIRHPGLVGVHDAGVDPQGRPYVIMDFVEGHSLSVVLHDGPLPAPRVVAIGAMLADALAHVHARGVVHRDVKPANVLLDTDGRPRLTDFGIARVVDATRVTATGAVVGTAAYMAPEQVRGEAVGPPADVYALGLVLLEAVTGCREYEGGPLESAVARLHRLPRIPDDVPDGLASVVRRMTSPEPDERPSASDVATSLRNGPVAVPPPHRRLVVQLGRRLAPAGALACLVAAALGGALTVIKAEPTPRVGSAPAAQDVIPPRALVAPAPIEAELRADPDPPAVAAVPTHPARSVPAPVEVARRATGAAAATKTVRNRSDDGDDDRNDDRNDDEDGRHRDGSGDRDSSKKSSSPNESTKNDRDDDGDDRNAREQDDDGDRSDKGDGESKGDGHGKGGKKGKGSGDED